MNLIPSTQECVRLCRERFKAFEPSSKVLDYKFKPRFHWDGVKYDIAWSGVILWESSFDVLTSDDEEPPHYHTHHVSIRHTKDKTSVEPNWGHYDMTLNEAREDFRERSA
jgi:hypothetical protein